MSCKSAKLLSLKHISSGICTLFFILCIALLTLATPYTVPVPLCLFSLPVLSFMLSYKTHTAGLQYVRAKRDVASEDVESMPALILPTTTSQTNELKTWHQSCQWLALKYSTNGRNKRKSRWIKLTTKSRWFSGCRVLCLIQILCILWEKTTMTESFLLSFIYIRCI